MSVCQFIPHCIWRGLSSHWRKSTARTAVPTQMNKIPKLSLSPTVNIIRVTSNTTFSIKTNPLTIFVPSSFYLISWCCCSKQKSCRELHSSHQAKISPCTTAVYDAFNTDSSYVSFLRNMLTEMIAQFFTRNIVNLDNLFTYADNMFSDLHVRNELNMFSCSKSNTHTELRLKTKILNTPRPRF